MNFPRSDPDRTIGVRPLLTWRLSPFFARKVTGQEASTAGYRGPVLAWTKSTEPDGLIDCYPGGTSEGPIGRTRGKTCRVHGPRQGALKVRPPFQCCRSRETDRCCPIGTLSLRPDQHFRHREEALGQANCAQWIPAPHQYRAARKSGIELTKEHGIAASALRNRAALPPMNHAPPGHSRNQKAADRVSCGAASRTTPRFLVRPQGALPLRPFWRGLPCSSAGSSAVERR